jgi:peptidoglycan/xylan/chitin deacetylase (PgdA/CDA1 family)
LNILDEKGVKATFFLNSNNKAPINSGNYPDIVRRMYNSGHHIGSHTHTHANLTALTVSEMWNEMNLFDQALSGIIGVRPVFMRPPFGEWNTQVLTAMGSWGYRVSWITVDTNDWRHVGQPNAAQLSLNRVNDAINATPTTYHISLAHDTLQETVEQFVSDAIDSIRAKGLQLVTFGDCVGAPPSTWYRS